jgi:hypothetical protein
LELEKQLDAASKDPAAAGATAMSIVSWTTEVTSLEATASKAVREQGLARRAFVDAMRIVDALTVQLQEARHGDRTDVMVALGATEFVMFTELRTTKIREMFKSDEESAAAQDLMVEVRLVQV